MFLEKQGLDNRLYILQQNRHVNWENVPSGKFTPTGTVFYFSCLYLAALCSPYMRVLHNFYFYNFNLYFLVHTTLLSAKLLHSVTHIILHFIQYRSSWTPMINRWGLVDDTAVGAAWLGLICHVVFVVAVPCLWSALSSKMCLPPSVLIFRRNVKSFSFTKMLWLKDTELLFPSNSWDFCWFI